MSKLLNTRLVFRSLLCAVALTIGLLSVMVGVLGRKSSLAQIFGFSCLFFVGYVCYPIIRTLLTGARLYYAIENFSFCAMLGITILPAIRVSGLPRKWGLPSVGFGGLMCGGTILLQHLLPLGNLNMMLAYSWLVSAYEWMTSQAYSYHGLVRHIRGCDACNAFTLWWGDFCLCPPCGLAVASV